jgi:uncharacterized protein YecT (DUF1311 family)
MMKSGRVTVAICAALICTPAWAESPADFSVVDANLKACLAKNGSTPGVDNCNAIATAAADRRLNGVYAGLVNALKHSAVPDDARDNPEILKRLIAAERAWIVFRDADCNYQSTVMLGGTGETNAYGACLYSQTKARVRALTSPDAPQNLR